MEVTKWKEDKTNELNNGYKLYYSEKSNAKNGVGIVVDNDLKEKFVTYCGKEID